MDDHRLGLLVRALRRRRGWRQRDLASRAGCSQQAVSIIERGHAGAGSIRILRDVARALDARVDLELRWRGGALDRLLDERHAALGAAIVVALERLGWVLWPEVTYSEFGERGSIDLVGWRPQHRAVLVVELKSELVSVEETLRRHDEKVRLAPGILRSRTGSGDVTVSRLLVLPDTRTARRQVARAGVVLARAYPDRAPGVYGWLAAPVGRVAGILFSSIDTPIAVRRARRMRSVEAPRDVHVPTAAQVAVAALARPPPDDEPSPRAPPS